MPVSYPQEIASRTAFGPTAVAATDQLPIWDTSGSRWERATLATVGGLPTTHYLPGTDSTSDLAAHTTALPQGGSVIWRAFKTPRPTTIVPDWNMVVSATDNPGTTVDDCVMAMGWNCAGGSGVQDGSKPGAWRASEITYSPGGTYFVIEDHVCEVYQPANNDWAGARRAISVEAFDAAGAGAYGLPVVVGHDADAIHMTSSYSGTVNGTGDSGTTWAVVRSANGDAQMGLNGKRTGGNSTITFTCGNATVAVAATVPLTIQGSTTQLGNVNTGFFGATPVAKPTVTGSRGSNAALASLLTALSNLGLVTDSSS